MSESEQTWLITGATRGFGRALAERVLADGGQVVAAVRRPDAMRELARRHPARLRVVEHDARDVAGATDVVAAATDAFGRLDVLVNNAGRGIVGAAEEVSAELLRDSLDLHLHGPAALVRAALPVMRAQRRGLVLQLSSQGGRLSFMGVGAYSAGKFALEGWSEALAWEVAPFGISVVLVEPSRFRTSFNEPDVLDVAASSPDYDGVLTAIRADMADADGVQEGDPERAAAVLVELAARVERGDDVPLRLPLGAEAVQRIGDAYRRDLASLEAWADTARGADFPGSEPPTRPIPARGSAA